MKLDAAKNLVLKLIQGEKVDISQIRSVFQDSRGEILRKCLINNPDLILKEVSSIYRAKSDHEKLIYCLLLYYYFTEDLDGKKKAAEELRKLNSDKKDVIAKEFNKKLNEENARQLNELLGITTSKPHPLASLLSATKQTVIVKTSEQISNLTSIIKNVPKTRFSIVQRAQQIIDSVNTGNSDINYLDEEELVQLKQSAPALATTYAEAEIKACELWISASNENDKRKRIETIKNVLKGDFLKELDKVATIVGERMPNSQNKQDHRISIEKLEELVIAAAFCEGMSQCTQTQVVLNRIIAASLNIPPHHPVIRSSLCNELPLINQLDANREAITQSKSWKSVQLYYESCLLQEVNDKYKSVNINSTPQEFLDNIRKIHEVCQHHIKIFRKEDSHSLFRLFLNHDASQSLEILMQIEAKLMNLVIYLACRILNEIQKEKHTGDESKYLTLYQTYKPLLLSIDELAKFILTGLQTADDDISKKVSRFSEELNTLEKDNIVSEFKKATQNFDLFLRKQNEDTNKKRAELSQKLFQIIDKYHGQQLTQAILYSTLKNTLKKAYESYIALTQKLLQLATNYIDFAMLRTDISNMLEKIMANFEDSQRQELLTILGPLHKKFLETSTPEAFLKERIRVNKENYSTYNDDAILKSIKTIANDYQGAQADTQYDINSFYLVFVKEATELYIQKREKITADSYENHMKIRTETIEGVDTIILYALDPNEHKNQIAVLNNLEEEFLKRNSATKYIQKMLRQPVTSENVLHVINELTDCIEDMGRKNVMRTRLIGEDLSAVCQAFNYILESAIKACVNNPNNLDDIQTDVNQLKCLITERAGYQESIHRAHEEFTNKVAEIKSNTPHINQIQEVELLLKGVEKPESLGTCFLFFNKKPTGYAEMEKEIQAFRAKPQNPSEVAQKLKRTNERRLNKTSFFCCVRKPYSRNSRIQKLYNDVAKVFTPQNNA